MQTEPFGSEELPRERPVFLQVLCILTFICSAWLVVTNTITYFTANNISGAVASAKIKMTEDLNKNKRRDTVTAQIFGKQMLSNMLSRYTTDNLRKNAIGTLTGAIFCLFGAVLMWRLKKIGYVFYVIGTVIGVAVPFYIFGNNFIAVAAAGFTAFFGLLFVIFYAMNLRSMH